MLPTVTVWKSHFRIEFLASLRFLADAIGAIGKKRLGAVAGNRRESRRWTRDTVDNYFA